MILLRMWSSLQVSCSWTSPSRISASRASKENWSLDPRRRAWKTDGKSGSAARVLKLMPRTMSPSPVIDEGIPSTTGITYAWRSGKRQVYNSADYSTSSQTPHSWHFLTVFWKGYLTLFVTWQVPVRTRVSEAAMRVMGNVIAACECKEETVKFQTYAANSFPVRDIEMLRKWNVRVPRLHCTVQIQRVTMSFTMPLLNCRYKAHEAYPSGSLPSKDDTIYISIVFENWPVGVYLGKDLPCLGT